jgi:glycosyltransferase involved in cell wall biosynthesis/SAM-dependent methyltransferase
MRSIALSDADLYRFGLRVGLRTLARSPLDGLKSLALPVEYVRCAEGRYVLQHLDVAEGHRVLDIGSPKLPSLFLAARVGARVHATDLLDYFFRRYDAHAAAALGPRRDLYRMEVQDARRLEYADETFDRVFSISAIEHIPGDGDSAAMREISRVLKPGGRCCLTVPWNDHGYHEVFKPKGDPDAYWVEGDAESVFYQREYDHDSLRSRLLDSAGLEALDVSFFGEASVPVERALIDRRLPRALRYALLPLHFPLSRIFLRPLAEDQPSRKKVAALTLRKPTGERALAPFPRAALVRRARRPSRVAVVVASPEILGGHAVQASALAEGLRKEGCDVSFLPVNPRFPPGLGWVRRWPYVRTLLNQALYLPSLRRLREAEVVHVFSAAYWSFLLGPVPAMLAARLFGKRVVLHYHSGEAEDHLARWGVLVHPWLRLAHELVVPSDYLREVFARHGYGTRVIPNVVDTARFRFRERRALGPRLLSARNLEPHYAVDTVIEAFALVRGRYPDARLTVAGYGREEARLRRLADSLGADGIDFVGRVEPPQMPALYDRHDVFVNASLVDNQPVSILEAFAAGLPVVTTGIGDIPAMVRDGQTGVIVPTRDPAAMAAAVVELLEQPERARLMARRARHEAGHYSWSGVRAAWADVYRRAA